MPHVTSMRLLFFHSFFSFYFLTILPFTIPNFLPQFSLLHISVFLSSLTSFFLSPPSSSSHFSPPNSFHCYPAILLSLNSFGLPFTTHFIPTPLLSFLLFPCHSSLCSSLLIPHPHSPPFSLAPTSFFHSPSTPFSSPFTFLPFSSYSFFLSSAHNTSLFLSAAPISLYLFYTIIFSHPRRFPYSRFFLPFSAPPPPSPNPLFLLPHLFLFSPFLFAHLSSALSSLSTSPLTRCSLLTSPLPSPLPPLFLISFLLLFPFPATPTLFSQNPSAFPISLPKISTYLFMSA